MVKHNLIVLLIILLTTQSIAQTTIAVIDFDGRGVSQNEANTITDLLRYEIIKLDLVRLVERGDMMAVIV